MKYTSGVCLHTLETIILYYKLITDIVDKNRLQLFVKKIFRAMHFIYHLNR